MLSLRDPWGIMVGIMHDLVEDSGISLDRRWRAGFPAEVVEAVTVVTWRPGEDYADCLARVKANPMALRVKLADLRDNLDESRIPEPTDADRRRWEKYRRALAELRRET